MTKENPLAEAYKCKMCGKQTMPMAKENANWEMQHLHIDGEEIKFLTCEKCKLLSPMRFLEKLEQSVKDAMI